MAQYRDNAVVLRSYKLKESDRIVVFMTENHGKIRAVAKGVRKSGSRFGGRLEPMNHVDVQFYGGRELDIVNQVELITSPSSLRSDLDRMSRGMSMVEVVDQLGMEREATPHLYKMLVGALETLSKTNSDLVLGAFFLKLLTAEGARPELDVCVSCQSVIGNPDGGSYYFNLDNGGVQCRECVLGRRISSEALQLLREILGGRMIEAINSDAGASGREVTELATAAIEYHTERRLKSMNTKIR